MRPPVNQSCGLATNNLKLRNVGLAPALASLKADIERHTVVPVVKPCCDDSRHTQPGDRAIESCTICSLRVTKEDLLDYEPDGDEVAMEEQ